MIIYVFMHVYMYLYVCIMITMFCCDNVMQFPSVPAEEEADQVTRDLLLVFAGPDALQRGFLKPEEAQGQGPQVAGVCRFQG